MRIPGIFYGVHTATTLVPILYEFITNESLTIDKKAILFSVYSIANLNLLRGRNSLNANRMNEDIWYLYKFISLIYLCFFTLVYIAFLLHGSKIFKIGFLENIIKDNYVTVIAMFPYFIHVINAVLMFTFYFELKFLNLALSQNLDVDYLFEDDKYAI